ncbi:hypothetical protein BYT27DRAFT_6541808 [Phlegmacium glaucopus]|nr:hypothetical protein BYT27DRAFT_6541808 [Phlegmacium glaucopus]
MYHDSRHYVHLLSTFLIGYPTFLTEFVDLALCHNRVKRPGPFLFFCCILNSQVPPTCNLHVLVWSASCFIPTHSNFATRFLTHTQPTYIFFSPIQSCGIPVDNCSGLTESPGLVLVFSFFLYLCLIGVHS